MIYCLIIKVTHFRILIYTKSHLLILKILNLSSISSFCRMNATGLESTKLYKNKKSAGETNCSPALLTTNLKKLFSFLCVHANKRVEWTKTDEAC